MQTYQSGIVISTIILLIYRASIIFSLTSSAAHTCATKLNESDVMAKIKGGYGECVNGVRYYYDTAGQKTTRTSDCGAYTPEPATYVECMYHELETTRSFIGFQILLTALQVLFFILGMESQLRFLNFLSAFIGGGGTVLGNKYVIVLNTIALLLGDFILTVLSPQQGSSAIGKARGPRGRFIGSG